MFLSLDCWGFLILGAGTEHWLFLLTQPVSVWWVVSSSCSGFSASSGDQPLCRGDPQQLFLATCRPMPLVLASTSRHTEIWIVMGGRRMREPSLRLKLWVRRKLHKEFYMQKGEWTTPLFPQPHVLWARKGSEGTEHMICWVDSPGMM